MRSMSPTSGRETLSWAHARRVQLRLIQPDKPNQNVYVESFNGTPAQRSINGAENTTRKVWALGWSVKRAEFGVLLSAKGHEISATTWPVDPFGEQSDASTARIKAAAGSPVTSASETQPTTAAANGSTLIAVGKRPLGTFPETPPYPASF